jgi:hypothetical protein
MSKAAALNLINALTQSTCKPFFAVEMLFDTAPLRLWTGHGERTIEGETYTGTGAIVGFDGMQEVMDLSATQFTINVSGISSSILSLAIDEDIRNRKCSVYMGEQSISDVLLVGAGRMDSFDWQDNGETSQMSLTVETALAMGERSSNWRYTSESHKARFPDDTFFDQVSSIQDVQLNWGQK